jgi:lysophospholipid hydrolase
MRARSDCRVVFACDATGSARPGHAGDPPYETSLSGWKVLRRRLTPFATPLRVPTIAQVMTRVAAFGARQNAQAARDLADFCLCIDVRGFGVLEFGKLEEIVEVGYRSAREIVAGWGDDDRFRSVLPTVSP